MTTTRVLVAGSANYDIIAPVGNPPAPHEKLRVGDYASSAGGSASNTARWLAILGFEIEFVSAVGDDSFGQECLRSLKASGVGITRVMVVPRQRTGLAFILSAGHEKRMFTFRAPDREAAYASVTAEDLSKVQHLHISAEITAGLSKLVRAAQSAGCSVSVEWNGRDMRPLTDSAVLNFMNLDEARRLTGSSTATPSNEVAREIVTGLKGSLVLTMGVDGAMHIGADGSIAHVPVDPVEPRDRTGGGDAFDAGVIAGYLRGDDVTGCLRSGLETARKALMIVGACP